MLQALSVSVYVTDYVNPPKSFQQSAASQPAKAKDEKSVIALADS
jgi:hypothetical protein